MFHILVDKRERLTFEAGSVFAAEHLTVGDFLVMVETRAILVIERKTWADLGASFKDGRKENIKKLLDYREKTGCKVAYIMEGKRPQIAAGIETARLQAHLDHIMWRSNVMVLYSLDKKGTLARIEEVARNIYTIPRPPQLVVQPLTDLALAKCVIEVKPGQQVLWEAVPRCGQVLARQVFPWTPFDYILNHSAAVVTIQNNANKSQLEVLNELQCSDAREPRAIKLLAAVKGISLKTAADLLREKSLNLTLDDARAATKGPLARIKKYCADAVSHPPGNQPGEPV